MAQPTLHFAVGATCATAITLTAGPLRRRWHKLGPLLAMAGGIWACLPDADHLLNRFGFSMGDSIAQLEYRHATSWWWDVFFFHGWLDRNLPGRGTIIGLAWLLVLVTVFFGLNAWKIGKLEREIEKLKRIEDTEEGGRA